MRLVSLEINDSFQTDRKLERISLTSDGFLRSAVTKEYLKNRGKLAIDKAKLIILMRRGTSRARSRVHGRVHTACYRKRLGL